MFYCRYEAQLLQQLHENNSSAARQQEQQPAHLSNTTILSVNDMSFDVTLTTASAGFSAHAAASMEDEEEEAAAVESLEVQLLRGELQDQAARLAAQAAELETLRTQQQQLDSPANEGKEEEEVHMTTDKEEIERLRAELSRLAEVEAYCTALEAEVEKHAAEALSRLTDELEAAVTSTTALRAEKVGLEDQVTELIARLEAVRAEMQADLEAQLHQLKQEHAADGAKLEEEIRQLTNTLITVQQEQADNQLTIDNLNSQNTQLVAEVQRLAATVGQLSDRKTALEATVSQLSDTKTALEATVSQLSDTKTALEAQLTGVEAALSAAMARLRETEAALQASSSTVLAEKQELEAQVRQKMLFLTFCVNVWGIVLVCIQN